MFKLIAETPIRRILPFRGWIIVTIISLGSTGSCDVECFAQTGGDSQELVLGPGLADLVLASTQQQMGAEAVNSAQPSSPSIEPLPDQATLFGRLDVKQAQLSDKDVSFYRTADKVSEVTERAIIARTEFGQAGSDHFSETYTWAAANLYHQPLYFEEVNLERYGIGPRRILQGPLSAAHFFTNIAVLPYHLGSLPPRTRVYNLGYYRPGDCVPYRYHRAPYSIKGFIAQGATAAGVVLLP